MCFCQNFYSKFSVSRIKTKFIGWLKKQFNSRNTQFFLSKLIDFLQIFYLLIVTYNFNSVFAMLQFITFFKSLQHLFNDFLRIFYKNISYPKIFIFFPKILKNFVFQNLFQFIFKLHNFFLTNLQHFLFISQIFFFKIILENFNNFKNESDFFPNIHLF